MSFCCGASKIGAMASVRRSGIKVNNVPILYCPVCQQVEPHPTIDENIDFIVEIAIDDDIKELDLNYYLSIDEHEDLFENCSTVNRGNKLDVIHSQIDIALDLLTVATLLNDSNWKEQLKKRLGILSKQKQLSKNI